MALTTAGIHCAINRRLSGAMEDCSIVRVQQPRTLCRQRRCMSASQRMFGSLWNPAAMCVVSLAFSKYIQPLKKLLMEQAAFKVDSDSGISVRYRNAITHSVTKWRGSHVSVFVCVIVIRSTGMKATSSWRWSSLWVLSARRLRMRFSLVICRDRRTSTLHGTGPGLRCSTVFTIYKVLNLSSPVFGIKCTSTPLNLINGRHHWQLCSNWSTAAKLQSMPQQLRDMGIKCQQINYTGIIEITRNSSHLGKIPIILPDNKTCPGTDMNANVCCHCIKTLF